MRLTLPTPPSANRLWRSVRGRVIPAPEAKAWKADAAWQASLSGCKPSAANMAVTVTYHPRLTAKGVASKRRLDVDNVLKPTLDALNGVAWLDDSQVVDARAVIGDPTPSGGLTVDFFEVTK